jgi:putative (di)nucleoside polyphosphate hydrolase
MNKPLPLRPNVCILIFRDNGDLILGERSNFPGVWQFPQGGVEPGDSDEESVYREAHEELGIAREHLDIVCKLKAQNDYDFRNPPEYALGRWRGQSQTFWVVRFLGKDSDVCVETDHPEFTAWRWVEPDLVLSEVEPVRLPGYELAMKEYCALWTAGRLAHIQQ